MPTQAQITANRRNAQKSTGPRTTEGKTAVSQNAAKHGLLSRQTLISSEDKLEFDLYRYDLLDELSPQTPMESMLAERIVTLSWRLKRAAHIQTQTIDALKTRNTSGPLAELEKLFSLKSRQTSENPPSEPAPDLTLGNLAIKDFSNARVLERLLMYERRIENSLYKTIIELQRLNLIKNLNTNTVTQFRQFSSANGPNL